MTINLTELRERANGGFHVGTNQRGEPIAVGPTFTPDEVLPLIDTAEAAIAVINKSSFHWSDHTTVRLHETLNRFTTT